MKKLYILMAMFAMTALSAQLTTVTDTSSAGDLSTQMFFAGSPTTSSVSTCPGTMTLTIPANSYVYSVDVSYDMTAGGQAWKSEQESYLKCTSTGNTEAAVSVGVGNNAGTFSYSRSNLPLANGVSTTGILNFELHAFRTWGGFGCSTNLNKVDAGTWIIAVTYGAAPTCLAPTGLTLNYPTHNQVNVGWTTGGASNWQLKVGSVGFNPVGAGTWHASTTTNYGITGLNASTTYDIYVRDSCGTGNSSLWVGPLTVTTLCAPTVAPTTENFDGTSWSTGAGWTNAGDAIDACWTRSAVPGSVYAWGTGSGGTGTNNTGPSADHSTGTSSGNYIYTEASNGAYANQASISSPLIDVASLSNPSVTFWYHMYGQYTGTIALDVWTGSAWQQNVWTKSGAQQSSSSAAWDSVNVSLVGFTSPLRVRFRGIRSFQSSGDMAIDDVAFENGPTCPSPTILTATAVGFTTADFTSGGGSASSHEFVVGAVGAAAGSMTNSAVATGNTGSLSGLSAGNSYDVYVRGICGSGDTSSWFGPLSIQTLCSPVSAPFTENFDGSNFDDGSGTYSVGDSLDPCWFRDPGRGNSPGSPYYWAIRDGSTSTPQTGPNDDATGGGNYAYTESTAGVASQVSTLRMVPVNISSLTNPQLSFAYHAYGNTMGSLKFEVWQPGSGWGSATTVFSGQQQSSQSSAWKDTAFAISATSDTIVVRFVAVRGSSNRSDMAIDIVKIEEAPSCPDPYALAVSAITATSASISWTTGGSSNWNVAFGPTGTVSPGSSFTAITSNPYVLTALTPGTTYDVYLRDSCGNGDVSAWVGPVTFSTPCLGLLAPFSENFDGSSWTASSHFDPGNVDVCWSRSATAGFWFKGGSGGTPSNNTGPSSDHTSGSGGYAYSESQNPTVFSTDLVSPLIKLDTLSSPEVVFWYHMYGFQVQKMELFIAANGGAYTSIWSKLGAQQTSNASPWEEARIDISTYASDSVTFKWVATRNPPGFFPGGDMAIDDFSVDNAPSCPAPSVPTSTATSTSSVTLAWTTGGATAWDIEYGPVGFTTGSGTVVPASSNPFTVTGLSTSTSYDFYVRDVCSATSSSVWMGPVAAQTNCGVITAPSTENFDATFTEGTGFANTASTIDPCWTRTPSTGTTGFGNSNYHWGGGTGSTPSNNTGPSSDHTTGSGSYAYVEASGQTGSTASLITPFYDLDTLSTPELRFWKHQYGNQINNFKVVINNGSGWTTIHNSSGDQGNQWTEVVVSLVNYLTDTVQFKFITLKPTSGGAARGDVAIDDLVVANAPTCLKPTNVAVTASTLTSITLSWTTGGASNWQIEYGPFGSVPGGGTIVNATSNPFTITGLSPGTTYAMVVRDSCGLGSTSAWSAISTGSTLCGTVLAPLTQNFDVGFNEGAMGPNFWNAGSTIDPCWSRNPNSAGTSAVYHWGGGSGNTPTANTGPTSDHTSGSGNYVYTESSYGSASETALLETPLIDLSALTAPELKFWFHMRGSSIQSLRIDIYSATSGSYTPIDSIVGDQGNAWFERVINLSTYVNQTIKVRFRAAKNSTTASQRADIAIDDFSISNAPNCPAPTNLAVTPLTSTTASVSWLSGGSGTAVLEYGPTGFTVGAGTLVTTTSNPYILTGLTAGVLYDLYVVDSCGASSYSTLTGPVSMQTFNCSNGCVYTLDLSDTFGDGWDANWQGSVQHKITLTTGGITTDYSMANGSAASFSINVCDGDTLRLRFVNGGQWSNECGWVLKDANGVTINSQTAGANITTGFKYNGSSSCSNPCPTPIASFTSSSNGLTITYDASASTGTALTYFWDYGDGNNGTVNPAVNPYSSAGNYQVTLIVTDQCGQTDTLIQNIEVCDTVLQPFTYTTQIFQIGFTGPLNPADYSYIAWNFGDGTSTTGADPSHTYSTGGQYTVVLTVVNLCGDTLTDTQVLDICSKPVAAFTWFIVSSSGSGMLVQFDATSTVGANSYLWSWGDGTSSTGTNYTQHNYSVPSLLYNVTLIVNSACGLSDTTTHRLDELGLDEPGALGAVNAYPNPLTGAQTLTIAHWLPQSRSLVTVSDGMGRVVLQRVLDFDTKGEALLGMQSLAAGVYHIELLADDRRAFLRIVTQK